MGPAPPSCGANTMNFYVVLTLFIVGLFVLIRKTRNAFFVSKAGYTITPTDQGQSKVVVTPGSAPPMSTSAGLVIATLLAGATMMWMMNRGPGDSIWSLAAAIAVWVLGGIAVSMLSKLYNTHANGRHPGGQFTVSRSGLTWPDGQKIDGHQIHRLVMKNTAKVPYGLQRPGRLKVISDLQDVSWRLDAEAAGKEYPLAGGMNETVAKGLMHELTVLLDFSGKQAKAADMKACPFCAELVRREAIKCKHCGSELNASRKAS